MRKIDRLDLGAGQDHNGKLELSIIESYVRRGILTTHQNPKARVAIIGNGPNHGENGEYIDGRDVVIRFNFFTTEGFEKHVGSKTDVWCLGNEANIKRVLHKPDCEMWAYRENPNLSSPSHRNINGDNRGGSLGALIIPREILLRVFDMMHPYKSSIGIFCIAYAIGKYELPIFISGFDGFAHNNGGNVNHHYWDNA